MNEVIGFGLLALYSVWMTGRWLGATSQLEKFRGDKPREWVALQERLRAAEERCDLLLVYHESTIKSLKRAAKQSAQLSKNKAFREALAEIEDKVGG